MRAQDEQRVSLLKLVTSPGKAFEKSGNYPNFKIPSLILVISGLPGYIGFYSMILSWAFSNDSASYDLFHKTIALVIAAVLFVMIFFVLLLFWFIRYKLLYFGAIKLGGEASPGLLKSRVGYCYLPEAIRGILNVAIILIWGNTDIGGFFTLASFMPGIEEHSTMFMLLSQVEIFNIWSLVLLVFAVASTCKIPHIKSIYVVVIFFLLATVGNILLQ